MVLKGDLFSKRVSSYVCIFCTILNNLARVIYVISNCHVAIPCITGSIKVNKMITWEYLSSAKEWSWTLELFSKRVLSLSWWFCYTFRSMPFKSSWNFVETHKDQVTFVPWEVYPCIWVYLHICSLTSFKHEKLSLSVSVQVVTTVMLYSCLISLRGQFCMISISLAEAS